MKSIRTPLWLKLGASFLAVALTTVYVGSQGISSSKQLSANSKSIATSATALTSLDQAEQSYTAMRMNLFGMIIAATNPSVSDELRTEYTQNQKDFDAKVDSNLAQWKATSPLAAKDGPILDAAIASHRAVVYGAAIPLTTGAPTTLALPAGQTSWTLSSTLALSATRYAHLLATFDDVRSQETAVYEQQVAKSKAVAQNADKTLKEAMIIGVIIALAAGSLLSLSLLRRIAKLRTLANAIKTGNLSVRANVPGRDELGDMGRALDESMNALSSDMVVISANARQVASASSQLTTAGDLISSTAAEVSDNVQMVAAASEEMEASIREISMNASSAATRASEIVDTAEEATQAFAAAVDSVSDISRVVDLISNIAEQTNLLALNATIEAARAGESGKGFAVVAGEVKELAKQTSSALANITAQIEAVNTGMKSAQSSVSQLTTAVSEISDSQTTIAGAVEEQSATTSEISRNVSQAAMSASQIASDISAISDGRGGGAAGDLAQTSNELLHVTDRFTTSGSPSSKPARPIPTAAERFGASDDVEHNPADGRYRTNA